MKIRFSKGEMCINTRDFVDSLGSEGRRDIIDSIICEEDIFREATNQIINGWTSLNSSVGSSAFCIEPWCALDVARRRIAEASSDIANQEIKRALREIERLKEQNEKADRSNVLATSRLDDLQYAVRQQINELGDDKSGSSVVHVRGYIIDGNLWEINESMGKDLLELNADLPNGICLTKGDARLLREAIDWFLENGK